MDKYHDVAFQIKRIHGASKVIVITIVVSALGTISKNAKTWLGKLDIPDIIGSAQLSVILGTALYWGKGCVSKLREAIETLLRRPRRTLRPNPTSFAIRKSHAICDLRFAICERMRIQYTVKACSHELLLFNQPKKIDLFLKAPSTKINL